METSQPTQHIAVPNSPVNQPKRLRASEGVGLPNHGVFLINTN